MGQFVPPLAQIIDCVYELQPIRLQLLKERSVLKQEVLQTAHVRDEVKGCVKYGGPEGNTLKRAHYGHSLLLS